MHCWLFIHTRSSFLFVDSVELESTTAKVALQLEIVSNKKMYRSMTVDVAFQHTSILMEPTAIGLSFSSGQSLISTAA